LLRAEDAAATGMVVSAVHPTIRLEGSECRVLEHPSVRRAPPTRAAHRRNPEIELGLGDGAIAQLRDKQFGTHDYRFSHDRGAIDRAAARTQPAMQLAPARRWSASGRVRLAYVELPGGKIELMEPTHPDSPIAKFLERNPKGGIHHFSLSVDDMDRTTRALGEGGVRILGDGKSQHNVAGGRIAFIHPADFLGTLVELEQHENGDDRS
jgi:methylmalonyl-CoA epimerase